MRYTSKQIDNKIMTIKNKVKRLRGEIEVKFAFIDDMEEKINNLENQRNQCTN